MMERLTKHGQTTHENGICCKHFNSKECHEVLGNCAHGCKWEEEVWSKLAHYEDLEEQGLLLRLPFKCDEVVWVAEKGFTPHKALYSCPSAMLDDIEHGMGIGYTKEAAEAALKEMG